MDDAWRHVFRYFRAAERIRYERVSKLWMRLLREYWKQLVSIDTNDLCVGVPAEYWSNCVAAVLGKKHCCNSTSDVLIWRF
ncbi:unnamed protein product [Gongylonema pulchrum]|uniref:Defective in cullin neddylation protein n=1 Tax=Gongylonema pulchrum TaxID=637853 RepID=A0A183DMZ5_9BILA|nr:unnamed protein product [Gongylonema pulchrum]